MATFIFAPLAEQGHVNPTLRITKALQARGHRVVYCGLPDLQDFIQREGFEFEPILEEFFPKDFHARLLENTTSLTGPRLLRFEWEMLRLQARVREAMLGGALDGVFRRLRPQLVLCDMLVSEPPLVAHGHGVRTLLLNTTIPLRREAGSAPLSSPLIPDGSALTALRGSLSWLRITYRQRLLGWLNRGHARYIKSLARRYGFPQERLDFTAETLCTRGPELVLCPREFVEMGTPRTRGSYLYAGPSVDLERQEPDFPWERLTPGKPLILVYLGTMGFRTQADTRLFRLLLQVAASRPEWQFVLGLGRKLDASAFDGIVPNVIAANRVPQVGLLRRATAMITHGGFNSVKECICLGVPMVVIPLQYDQPGISSRVVHHGLGTRILPAQLSVDTLLAGLDQVVREGRYKQAVSSLSARFQRAEQDQPAAELIERFVDVEATTPVFTR